ncbi:MAG TPA: CoA transferase [Dehalococcoidia bacterium]|nr:CoA transferase [Dehalococcoidia bacterium]
MSRLPLAGVRIVDFTWAWAGPQATLLLGMLGAEIIKIESRARLDHTRLRSLMAGPTLASPDHSVIFADLNVNKLSLTLNLTHAEAVEIIKRLVKVSDVVAENMRPGVLQRLGLGYEALRAVKPDIIMLSSSAVGSTGPERTYVGYAPNFAALGGIAHITGPAEGPPTPLSGAIDLRVGTTSAFAILAALYHRARSGQGQYIDLSSTEAISAMIGDTFLEHAMNGRSPGRAGNRDRTMAPHNCYRCAGDDRWVTIAVATDEEWRALCTVIADPRLDDERFSDGYGRWQDQDELDQIISEWTASRSPQEITQTLQTAGVAAMPAHDGRSLVEDPQLRERGLMEWVEHPLSGKRLLAGPPWRFSKTPASIRQPAPLLGQHNHYVLHELLGLSEEEIQQLVDEEVVY